MIKKSQSLLDFINIIPLQALITQRSPVTNKEASALYAIFQGEKTSSGNIVIPYNIDNTVVTALVTKGFIKSKNVLSTNRTVEITKKGKDIIRNIILMAEKSSFDKINSMINYESIHNLTTMPVRKAKHKIASTHILMGNLNWMQKLALRWN